MDFQPSIKSAGERHRKSRSTEAERGGMTCIKETRERRFYLRPAGVRTVTSAYRTPQLIELHRCPREPFKHCIKCITEDRLESLQIKSKHALHAEQHECVFFVIDALTCSRHLLFSDINVVI